MDDFNRSPLNVHSPVLYQYTIDFLQPKSPGKYVDGTIGAGGHAVGILEASQPEGCLLGLDIDKQALTIARRRLKPYGKRALIFKGSYADIDRHLKGGRVPGTG